MMLKVWRNARKMCCGPTISRVLALKWFSQVRSSRLEHSAIQYAAEKPVLCQGRQIRFELKMGKMDGE